MPRWPAILLSVLAFLALGSHSHAVDQEAINRAIASGVAHIKALQTKDGAWNASGRTSGATALCGLTLLECGGAVDDPAVRRAADFIRRAVPEMTDTYNVSFSILFLDRLGDPADVPLIQTLGIRLAFAQKPCGGYYYHCPVVPEEQRTLSVRSELGAKAKPLAEKKGGSFDFTEIQKKLEQRAKVIMELEPLGPRTYGVYSLADNSNTMVATLGLWVARRHGVPVRATLRAIESCFRKTQSKDGGWDYNTSGSTATPTMTNSGIFALAIGGALSVENRRDNAGAPALKDASLIMALNALSTTIGTPVGADDRQALARVPKVGDNSFYFLWSLERVATALGLETIGKKDWYQWGAEILLANQSGNGAWIGKWSNMHPGADTCFALLFLVRSNLARDLTARMRGRVRDPGHATLRAGGVGLKGAVALKPGIEPKAKSSDDTTTTPTNPFETTTNEKPSIKLDSEAGRLVEEIVRAPSGQLNSVLERIRDAKGVANTEALAAAISQLNGESRNLVRDALAARLSRMRAASLANYLKDEDVEIRRASALALAMKESKEHIPDLIELLRDRNEGVVRSAHAALKELTQVDLGPAKGASAAEKERAIDAWKTWWKKNKR